MEKHSFSTVFLLDDPTARLFILLALTLGSFLRANSQCVTSYPYLEDFESGPAGWTANGGNNDWTWGQPNKPVINKAASGQNCWVTGTLTGSSYAFSEKSWVLSPCFDLTLVAHPFVRFKIWWESEFKYDGANLQYSLDDGATWTTIGGVNEPTDCYTANWYNNPSVNFLAGFAAPNQGWSGNVQPTVGSCQGGNGSAGWVEAKHCLASLAGKSNVQFRFTFGSGTSCNNFDGVAFDDFAIEEAPQVAPEFTSTCIAPTTFHFAATATNCPSTSWAWNFGDNGTAVGQNTDHTFPGPGTYTVTLTAGNACGGSSSASETFTLTDPAANWAIAGLDTTIFLGNSVILNGSANIPFDIKAYTWTPPLFLTCDSCQLTLATPTETTVYTLQITDKNGCTATDQRSIAVNVPGVYIPNVVAPNSNRDNIYFTVFGGPAVAEIDLLQVFDRWGELVFENAHFEASRPELGWDGRARGDVCNPAVFVYVAIVRFINGQTELFSGDVTVE